MFSKAIIIPVASYGAGLLTYALIDGSKGRELYSKVEHVVNRFFSMLTTTKLDDWKNFLISAVMLSATCISLALLTGGVYAAIHQIYVFVVQRF